MRTFPTRPAIESLALALMLALQGLTAGAATDPGLRAVYETTRSEGDQPADAGREDPVERKTLTARLTPSMLAVRDDGIERIFDFSTGRVVVLDHARRSSYEFSLYAEPGFREHELVNRAAMSRVFGALFGEKYDLVDAETELGMRASPPAKLKMSEQRRGEERVFVLNKREAVSFVPATVELPATLSRALERLYLFEAQLHPQVRAALMKDARLPARLSYGFRLYGKQTAVTWELREAALEELDLHAAAAQYTIGPLQPEPMLEAAWRVRAGQAGSPPTLADYQARAERLLTEGRAFESFLVGMEAGFAVGEMPEQVLRRARDAAASDPRMAAYSQAGAIEAANGDAKEALRLLEPLDAAAVEGGPSIYVQRANQYVRLGSGDRALEEFGRALAVNPFMFGPWHDAGWLYWNRYAAPMAWACWDAARAIAPANPAMKDVNEMEAALRRKHPEFF